MLQSVADELRTIVREATPRLNVITELSGGSKPSEERWSKKQIIGHLIDSAGNNHQRFVRSQLVNPLQLEGYEQERWVVTQRYQDESWKDLITLWGAFNIHLAHLIASVPAEKLGNTVQLGPGDPVTLEFLMKDYLRHLKHHLGQVLEK
jgi:hypothetical protein